MHSEISLKQVKEPRKRANSHPNDIPRVPAAEIFKLSLSPYFDDIAVFHVRAVSLRFFFSFFFFSILSLANLAGVSNSRVEVAGKYPWLPLLGGGEEEGGLCLPDRARHRDRDQALPGRAERHRQATHRQHQHPVRRQLRHPLCHLPVQGEFYFSRIFWIFGKTTGIGDILVWMSWLQH